MFRRLFEKQGSVASNEELEERFATSSRNYTASNVDFSQIPGSPLAYWISDRMRKLFQSAMLLHQIAEPRQGMSSSDNDRFLRLWHEVDYVKISFNCRSRHEAKLSGSKWFPYNKGGAFRKWYGNNIYLINWQNDGEELKVWADWLNKNKTPAGRLKNKDYYFKPAITWTDLSSSSFGVRQSDPGFIFDVSGSSAFPPDATKNLITGFLCSRLSFEFLKVLNPTMHFQVGNVGALPIIIPSDDGIQSQIDQGVENSILISRIDWDTVETSWGFSRSPLLVEGDLDPTVSHAWENWRSQSEARILRLKQLEEENNRLFLSVYGLKGEFPDEVSESEITLYRPDREEDMKRLISGSSGGSCAGLEKSGHADST